MLLAIDRFFRLAVISVSLFSVLASAPSPTTDAAPDSLNPQKRLLTLNVAVKDKFGRSVKDLERENFAVFDNNQPRDIATFSVEKTPSSVGLVIDMSRSMQSPIRSDLNASELVRPALTRFFQAGDPANKYFAIAFSDKVNVISDWPDDQSAIADKIGQIKVKGQSAVYDACYAAFEKVLQGPNTKRAVILISDEMDNCSKHSVRDLREFLRAAGDIQFYLIRASLLQSQRISRLSGDNYPLEDLVRLSGGANLLTSSTPAVTSAFVAIAHELQNQYTIDIQTPPRSGRRTWHDLRVELRLPKSLPRALQPLTVQTRQGYYLEP